MPEIREQAYDVARLVSRSLHGEARRRPVDPYGLTLSTDQSAADRYNAALGRLLRLQGGVEDGLAEAVAADEGSSRHTPRWPCSGTSGVPPPTGRPPSGPPTARRPSAT